MGKKTMGVAVPVPVAALTAANKEPFAEEARKVAKRRIAEALVVGEYEQKGPTRERFATRAQYVAGFPQGKVPAGLPAEVEAVMITEIEVKPARRR